MKRRVLLRWLASVSGAMRFGSVRAWAQTADFPGKHGDVLRALAAVVLPSEVGSEAIVKVAQDFERWVRDYRPGAEMDHGYGNTRIRTKPASPAPAYLKQLGDLRAQLASSDAESRHKAVEAALEAAGVNDLPRTPSGQHVATDLMAFYFRSSDANDLCYRAAIGRDLCRGLAGSENSPAPLKGKAG
ncbi:MAG TPA: hypothetical protein VLY04_07605 [Bryobacteraceae bacterium]|nr:hypothetical protein [Bryobacteraceae bacterium]